MQQRRATRAAASACGRAARGTLGKTRLPECWRSASTEARAWLAELRTKGKLATEIEPVLNEIASRLGLLERVGLGYLTLDRPPRRCRAAKRAACASRPASDRSSSASATCSTSPRSACTRRTSSV
jgi:hypothetical protein